ncbi:trypsin-1-like [Phymastichus coffea]|uniref:trypsin-1-like n=1 Tax=Phymastichus coffea TaxID=108790 RepID=UPI00273AC94B|nr:trypsin-1-like [Phymastichus coffea]
MWKFVVLIPILLTYTEGNTEGPDIVGGTKAKEAERPFQVSLQEVIGYHFCGGSIISEYYVLTAAHCTVVFDKAMVGFLFAAVGMLDVRHPGQNHKLSDLIVHEKYDPNDSFRNDISLAKVQEPFTFNTFVQPVPLPKSDFPVPANSSVVLSGWGDLGGTENESPHHLRVATLYVVDQEKCKKIIETGPNHVYKTNLCAYDPNTRKGQCTKDSGGPLTLNGTLVGIVSWSFKDPYCGSTKRPAQYTRVSEYIDWIKEHTA